MLQVRRLIGIVNKRRMLQAVELAAFAAVVAGVSMIWLPLGFIVVGVATLFLLQGVSE